MDESRGNANIVSADAYAGQTNQVHSIRTRQNQSRGAGAFCLPSRVALTAQEPFFPNFEILRLFSFDLLAHLKDFCRLREVPGVHSLAQPSAALVARASQDRYDPA